MMKQISWFNLVLSLVLLTATRARVPEKVERLVGSEPPPATFRKTDLVGTWEGHYGGYAGYGQGLDRLILRADGTFKQIYEIEKQGYVYETPWNEWWMERFPDGRVRVHLEGARYYVAGIERAERDGLDPTGLATADTLYDWFAEGQEKWVPIARKLVLNVRLVSSGELVLAHMSTTTDPPNWEELVRVSSIETASPLQTPTP